MQLTPKDFELLLCEFCKQDLPSNFKVEHDIKDEGKESQGSRQIDTKISGRLGVSEILICGEAKNWSDKVGSEVIDGLVGKYLSGEIKANKVLIFSMNGFTTTAVNRAKAIGIELLEPAELGKPIVDIPHIVGVGYLGQMRVKTSCRNPQETIMPRDPRDYIILKGEEEISFSQNIYRQVVKELRALPKKSVNTEPAEIGIVDKNVLYELKFKRGYKYTVNFEVQVSLIWDYFYKNFKTGILTHVNTGETKYVNLSGEPLSIIEKVLLSDSKVNIEKVEELISQVVNKNQAYTYQVVFSNPDSSSTDPEGSKLSYIC